MKLNEKYYKDLYDEVVKFNNRYKHQLTICPAIKGELYDECEKKIMFVGRAINGWCPIEDGLSEDEVTDRVKRCEQCTLNWVVGKENWSRCRENGCEIAKGEDKADGRGNKTPFWQMVQHICNKEGLDEEYWFKNIVWTNLYKASYVSGGNPYGFYEQQIDLCNDILINDIEQYNPSKIYFITEKNDNKRTWFCEEYKNSKIHFKRVYEYLKDKNIEVYVLTRPEFHVLKTVYENRQDLKGNKIEE